IFDYAAGGLYILSKAPSGIELDAFLSSNGIGENKTDWPAFFAALEGLSRRKEFLRIAGQKNRAIAEKKFDRSIQKEVFFRILRGLFPSDR
ncbi:MAG: hypothetical protein Q7R47_04710, partial [Candidatus Diapherotrites archaeon]|nr:hypothetical protein [Candidatus Diapherotrites archaeon]